MYVYMKGTALESVMDIPLTGPETAKEKLDEYQRRFLLESDSQLLPAQFACVVQLPNESVQKLHARMRVLFHLVYPDASTRNDIFLIERFIAALNNREVQSHVRRRKLATYAAALVAGHEETSFVLMDLATHTTGGLQVPTPGDTSFIAALKGRRPALSRAPRRSAGAFTVATGQNGEPTTSPCQQLGSTGPAPSSGTRPETSEVRRGCQHPAHSCGELW